MPEKASMDQKRLKSLRARHRDRLADLFHGQPDVVATLSRRGWNREAYPITSSEQRTSRSHD
jgi:hypothetical protein